MTKRQSSSTHAINMFMMIIGPIRMHMIKNKQFHGEYFVDGLLPISVMSMQSNIISTYFKV